MDAISGVQHQLPNAGLDFPSPPFQAFNQDLPIPNMTFVVPSASYSFGCRDLLVASRWRHFRFLCPWIISDGNNFSDLETRASVQDNEHPGAPGCTNLILDNFAQCHWVQLCARQFCHWVELCARQGKIETFSRLQKSYLAVSSLERLVSCHKYLEVSSLVPVVVSAHLPQSLSSKSWWLYNVIVHNFEILGYLKSRQEALNFSRYHLQILPGWYWIGEGCDRARVDIEGWELRPPRSSMAARFPLQFIVQWLDVRGVEQIQEGIQIQLQEEIQIQLHQALIWFPPQQFLSNWLAKAHQAGSSG